MSSNEPDGDDGKVRVLRKGAVFEPQHRRKKLGLSFRLDGDDFVVRDGRGRITREPLTPRKKPPANER